ncbi:DUF6456 domain-containing protein [Frigidibacter sp. MR17.14]|uniref:DUF6456 domain-containing protein n=1 Tax=Frigidibacter sp. MR17.14 TaxID=3126509 RepID=UPI003012FAEA
MSASGKRSLPKGGTGGACTCAPENLRLYLSHVEDGQSIRALARDLGCHASTVLRRVRRFEARRDDPLVDEALGRFARRGTDGAEGREDQAMSQEMRRAQTGAVQHDTSQPMRILARLAEPGAFLAVAPDMERAAVLRDGVRLAVAERGLLQQMAVSDWIALTRRQGRVLVYEISGPGRAALRRHQAGEDEAPGFAEQHRVWEERSIPDPEDGRLRRQRANLAESPVAVLARRRERDGAPFLAPELVAAGERLREDFELAQLGPRVAQNWERFLTAGDRGGLALSAGPGGGSAAARDRVAAALRALGPGLGDVVLRCCCYLEGLETAEQRMGWSARSGKIVLRIALVQLKRHYDETYGGAPRLIG